MGTAPAPELTATLRAQGVVIRESEGLASPVSVVRPLMETEHILLLPLDLTASRDGWCQYSLCDNLDRAVHSALMNPRGVPS